MIENKSIQFGLMCALLALAIWEASHAFTCITIFNDFVNKTLHGAKISDLQLSESLLFGNSVENYKYIVISKCKRFYP